MTIIESMEDNWVVYEILMQHKNMLHSQIDLLIKENKRCEWPIQNML
jgi:ParB family chromosome partitioning protein